MVSATNNLQGTVHQSLTRLRALLSPASAADIRHRGIAFAALSSLVSRISGLILTYLSVSLAIGKLGTVNFGLWMTVNSMSALMPFADFGLGNGLVSYVSRRIGERNEGLIAPAVGACLYIASMLGGLLVLAGISLTHTRLLSVLFSHQSPESLAGVAPAVGVFFFCLGATLPLSIVEKVQMAAQETYISNVWQITSNICVCAALYYVARGGVSLLGLVTTYSGIPIILKLANFSLYFRARKAFAPELRHADWKTGKYILKCGLSFVLLQSSVAIGYTSDNLILAARSGAVAVATYDVVQRLFALTVIAELSIVPLWGAFGEALSSGDISWVKRTFYRSLCWNGMLVLFLSSVLVMSAPTLIGLWTHGKIHPTWSLIIAFALWRVLNVVQGNLSVLLNHESTLKMQSIYFAIAACSAFALKFALLRFMGPAGVVIATVLSFTAIYLLPSFKAAAKLFHPIQAAEGKTVQLRVA